MQDEEDQQEDEALRTQVELEQAKVAIKKKDIEAQQAQIKANKSKIKKQQHLALHQSRTKMFALK